MSKVSISGYGDSLTVNGVCIGELSPDEHESIEKQKGGQNYAPIENVVISKVKDSSTLIARKSDPDDINKYIESEIENGAESISKYSGIKSTISHSCFPWKI